MELPTYPHLKIHSLAPGAILLFYNGNKLTEYVGKHLYKHKYDPPAFHAALYIGGPKKLYINVGATVTIRPLSDAFKSTRRVDAIVYNMSPRQEENVIAEALTHAGKVYDVKGFLSYGRKIPIIGRLIAKIKPSENLPFCSDHVQDSYRGIRPVAFTGDERTAPWDLLEYAEAHMTDCAIYNLHEGEHYPY